MDIAEHYRIQGGTAEELVTSVETGVRSGDLTAGGTLPTVRALAAELGVGAATVASAYRELRRRGVVGGVGRQGTTVRARTALRARPPIAVPEGVRDLLRGAPDPELLPREGPPDRRIQRRGYGEPPLAPSLARIAGERLAHEGIDVSHLAAVGGALDGVERVLACWLRPGDRVAVEDPGYTAILDLLAAMGLVAVPMELDEFGARPEALLGAIGAGASAVLFTPRAQNPTGAAWDGERSDRLRRALERHPDVAVIEDDHAGPIAGPGMYTLTPGRPRWATIRSVSKWLGPDLRVAVVAGDEATVSGIEGRQALGAGWVSYLLQESVADLWADPAVDRLLERATEAYRQRRQAFVGAMASRGVPVTGRSGLCLWVPVGDEPSVVAGLLGAGWAVAPGERFRILAGPGVRIATATLGPDESPRLAADLATVLSLVPVRTD